MTMRPRAKTAAAMPRRGKMAVQRGKPNAALGILDARLGYFIRRAQIWIFQDFIHGLADLDLSPAQFSVLAVIDANAGLSQAELSSTLGIERARLVRMLHELGRRNLTRRLPSSTDARSHALQLTAEGARVLARARMLSEKHEARLIKRIGADHHRTLMTILRDF